MEQDYIKLIFGLKLKQIRTDKNLSLFGLSKLSGLSKSYLNEIEKGKKYPKPDKIIILSEKLEVPYDEMVSLKLDKNLAPVGELLRSKMFKEIPLGLFGIQESDLIDIVSSAPVKVNAFINTIIQIAKHYNVSRESFFLASVRSYQEANNNYFGDIEKQVKLFAKEYQVSLQNSLDSGDLAEILAEEYGYSFDDNALNELSVLGNLRSMFIPKSKTLLLAKGIGEAQRNFIYAKEIAYNYMGIEKRLYTFPWVKFDSFDEVLNNFYASYFAGALILPQDSLIDDLKTIFQSATFSHETFLEIFDSYNASPESLYRRLTNILPYAFGMKDLFFLRFSHDKVSGRYELNKELHLSRQHAPRANEINEHYCRRWVSLKVLHEITINKNDHVFDVQLSYYPDEDKTYLVFSSATKDPFKKEQFRSISLGLLVNNPLKNKLKFIDDSNIPKRHVGVTCERCSIVDCEVRQVPAKILKRQLQNEKIERIVDELNTTFGK
ncbi:MAG: helix-turn-helix domain-containing protein [Bacteroidota bacterium]